MLTTIRSSLITPVFVEIGYFHFHASGRLTVTNALNWESFLDCTKRLLYYLRLNLQNTAAEKIPNNRKIKKKSSFFLIL